MERFLDIFEMETSRCRILLCVAICAKGGVGFFFFFFGLDVQKLFLDENL